MKNVLIISSSPRKGGNSDLLCDEFMVGAKESGNNVEKILLVDKKVGFCNACGACYSTGKCVQKDAANEIIEKIMKNDVIVLATPTYFYAMSAQLKALIDRTCGVYQDIRNKEFYVIVTAADHNKEMLERVVDNIRGFFDCLDGAQEKGIMLVGGVVNKGDVKNTEFMKQAYEMGKNIK